MTVHKSKGLEFPVVWIVETTYAGAAERAKLATHADLGLALNLQEDELNREAPRPASFDLIRLVEAQMERAEKKRLLYVAATRARDHLMISGALARARLLGDHWLGHIVRALGLEEEDRPDFVDYPNGRIDLHWHMLSAKG
jgi:ATP-dependent exoDNAse (exonuclease V) beta subunit